VFGAGAIGGHIAARLARGGAEVSVVARGAQLKAIQTNGLRIEAVEENFTAQVAAAADPAMLGPQDAVIVTVKAPALPSVAASIAPLLRADTPVAFVMNGIPWWYFHAHGGALEGRRLPVVDPGDAVWNAVGPAQAIGGVVYSSCTVSAPGVIRVLNNPSRVMFGEPDGSLSPRIAALAAPLRAGGIEVTETPDIRAVLWAKLLGNLSSGPLAVLSQAAPADIYREPACLAATRAMMAEGVAVAAALGLAVKPNFDRRVKALQEMVHRPSILQDLQLGRPMEIAGIFESALELARLVGVATPMLDMMVALMRVRAREAKLY
jgi:2-dehydropantoate 2-reductase